MISHTTPSAIARFWGILFGILLFVTVSAAHAQSVPDLSDLSISMIPLNPAPGQTVTLSVQSFAIDLTQASLSWQYGNKAIGSGIGKTSVSVIAPAAGATATATVTVSGFGSAPVSTSITLNPGSVDLLWEAAGSYTPPFYKGKAGLSIGGAFRVVAIPTVSAPTQVTVAWSRNSSAVQSASGLNKTSILLQNTIFNKIESIAATVYGGGFQGNDTVVIPVGTPSVIAYQKKEGFTDYAHGSSDTIPIGGSGTTLRFEPYNFSITSPADPSLSVGLSVDGQPVSGDPVANELRITHPNQSGTHTLSFSATTQQYNLQNIQKLFTILFQ